jgi:hypothetical protein
MYITYNKDVEMIQPLEQHHFWPPGGQSKNQVGPKFVLLDNLTFGYMCTEFQAIALAVTKRTTDAA